jgi:AcrR family transcriptional regulator
MTTSTTSERPGADPGGRGRRRADAERSIAAIIEAGLRCFVARPDVSMSDIAREAGVSRVTLYAHFPSREALLDAVLELAVTEANAALDADDRSDLPAREALVRLLHSSWRILDRHGSLRSAVAQGLPETRVREQHERVLDRVRALIVRGQREGAFRTDLPRDWLVTVMYSLLHATADEVLAGRLDPGEAPDVLEATVLSALRRD